MSGSPYFLSRDLYASMRLNLQHYLVKDALGYLLHPSININRPGPLKIADLGTGTGIWLLDLSRTLGASAQLDGFDISSAQFPAKEQLPANVRLEILDSVNSEPPKELQNQYDIVHLRFFVGIIQDRDPTPVLHNALKLLRPGGYIQWDECDSLHITVTTPEGKSAQNASSVIELIGNTTKQSANNWIAHLPDQFTNAKLEDVKHEIRYQQAWQRKMAADNACAGAGEIVATLFDEQAREAKEWRQVIARAMDEVRLDGVEIGLPFTVVVGRKGGR